MKFISRYVSLSLMFSIAYPMYQNETPAMRSARLKLEYEEGKKLYDLTKQTTPKALENYLASHPKFDINDNIFAGSNFLHWASFFNNTTIISYLVNKCNARLESHNEWARNTPLCIAAGNGNLNATTMLLFLGANVGSINRDGELPLQAAICAASTNPDDLADPEEIYLPIINALLQKDSPELRMVVTAINCLPSAWLLAIHANLPQIVGALSGKLVGFYPDAYCYLNAGLEIARAFIQKNPYCSQKLRDANTQVIATLENAIKNLVSVTNAQKI